VEFIAELLIGLVQFICEVLLQFFGDLVAEFLGHSVREALRPSQPPRRILGLIGYTLMGGILGALSLLIFRHHFAITTGLRLATLVVGPGISALAAAVLSPSLQRYFGTVEFRWRFTNAYAFSLAFALIRFAYAH
jgi:hypothetical protein